MLKADSIQLSRWYDNSFSRFPYYGPIKALRRGRDVLPLFPGYQTHRKGFPRALDALRAFPAYPGKGRERRRTRCIEEERYSLPATLRELTACQYTPAMGGSRLPRACNAAQRFCFTVSRPRYETVKQAPRPVNLMSAFDPKRT